MVRMFPPLCWAVESCCSWQGEKGKFFSFLHSLLYQHSQFNDNASEIQRSMHTLPFWICMLSFGHCVSRGFLGLSTSKPFM